VEMGQQLFKGIMIDSLRKFDCEMLSEFKKIEEEAQPRAFRKPKLDELNRRSSTLSSKCLQMEQVIRDAYEAQSEETKLHSDRVLSEFYKLFSDILLHMSTACDMRSTMQSEMVAKGTWSPDYDLSLSTLKRKLWNETYAFSSLLPELKRSAYWLLNISVQLRIKREGQTLKENIKDVAKRSLKAWAVSLVPAAIIVAFIQTRPGSHVSLISLLIAFLLIWVLAMTVYIVFAFLYFALKRLKEGRE